MRGSEGSRGSFVGWKGAQSFIWRWWVRGPRSSFEGGRGPGVRWRCVGPRASFGGPGCSGLGESEGAQCLENL